MSITVWAIRQTKVYSSVVCAVPRSCPGRGWLCRAVLPVLCQPMLGAGGGLSWDTTAHQNMAVFTSQDWAQVKKNPKQQNTACLGPGKQSTPSPCHPLHPQQLSKGTERLSAGSLLCRLVLGGRQPQHHPHPPRQSSLCEVTQLCVWK